MADVAGLVHTDPNISELIYSFFNFCTLHCLAFFCPGNGNCARLPLQDHIIDIPGTERSPYSPVLIKCGSFAVTAQDQPGDSHIYSAARNEPCDLVSLKSREHCVMLWVIPVRQVVPLHLPPRLLGVPAGIVGSSQCRDFGCSPQSGCFFALTLHVGVCEVDLSVPCLLKALLGWRGVVL